jgi:CspA family cold shock protein
MHGIIKWFSNEKGYGFITDMLGTNIFFHVSSIRGADLPSVGDSVSFNTQEGKKGPVAVDIEIVAKCAGAHKKPFYGKKIEREEVVTPGSSKVGTAAGLGVLGAMLGGPIGATLGAILGGAIGKDEEGVTKKVTITSLCIRCGDKGLVTSRINERTGFQCPTCGSFWKVPDHKLPPDDLETLKKIDFESN